MAESAIKKRQRALGTGAIAKYRKYFAEQNLWIETREGKTNKADKSGASSGTPSLNMVELSQPESFPCK